MVYTTADCSTTTLCRWGLKYELMVVTRHDDLVWLTRHHELLIVGGLHEHPASLIQALDESDLVLLTT